MRPIQMGRILVALVVLTAGGLVFGSGGEDPAGIPTASAAGSRYNVVLIVTDDQTADSLPHDPSPMPWLQARATDPDDRWVQFTTAVSNISLCCPARATLLTGQYGHHTGVLKNGDANQFRDGSTLATWLDGVGYHTGLVGKYFNAYPWNRGVAWKPPGWDRWAAVDFNPGTERYYDYRLVVDGAYESYGSSESDYLTDVLADKAVDFIETAPASQPFFLYFAPIAGHHPWTPAPRHTNALASMQPVRLPSFNEQDVSDKPGWVRALPLRGPSSIAQVDTYRRNAFETLLAADDAVRQVVDALQRRGALENTVIVFTSDHGHAFGEHRWVDKRCEYEECNRVPLLIRHPAGVQGVRNDLITNADVAPTIAEAAGVAPPIAIDGLSLIPAITGSPLPARDGVVLFGLRTDFYSQPGYWGLRTTQYTYVELDTGEREMYDLAGVLAPADPYQLQNRAGQPAYAQVQTDLAAKLATLRASTPGAIIDVSESKVTPTPLQVAQGMSVQWRFTGTQAHSVVDQTGLGLFDSGTRLPGETFSRSFVAAGSYRYGCGLHPGEMSGVVAVPIQASPEAGNRTTPFGVTWATEPAPAGFVYDVQIRRPGAASFVNWRTATSASSAAFTPDGGTGSYTFRSRLRKPTGNRSSAYSPPVTVRVS